MTRRSNRTPTVDDNPVAMRGRLVAEIKDAADADTALFYCVCQTASGPRIVDNVVSQDPRLVSALYALDRTLATLGTNLPDVCIARPRELRTFLETKALFGSWEAFAERPLTRWLARTSGVGDQIRLLAFHGERYLGWIGAFRTWGARPFEARDRRRLAPLVERCLTVLTTADALEATRPT